MTESSMRMNRSSCAPPMNPGSSAGNHYPSSPAKDHDAPIAAAHNAMLDMIEASVRTAIDMGMGAPLTARLDRLLPRPAPAALPVSPELRLNLATAMSRLREVSTRKQSEVAALDAGAGAIAEVLRVTSPEAKP